MLGQIQGKGARVIAVSAGSASDAAKLKERLELGFPLLADGDLRITKAFGVVEGGKDHPRPATFVLDGEHKVLFFHVGANAADRPATKDILSAL